MPSKDVNDVDRNSAAGGVDRSSWPGDRPRALWLATSEVHILGDEDTGLRWELRDEHGCRIARSWRAFSTEKAAVADAVINEARTRNALVLAIIHPGDGDDELAASAALAAEDSAWSA